MKSFAVLAGVFALVASVVASPAEAQMNDLETRQHHHGWGGHHHTPAHTHGKKCRGNYACKTNVWGARPSCSAKGVCGFKCLRGFVAKGNKCVPPKPKNQCWRNSQCHTEVENGSPVCWRGKCTFECSKGYHRDGDECVENQPVCDSNTCYPVQDGYSTCEDGECSYHCPTYLGYTLFTNSKKTAYRCINLESDPKNCGEYGNVCKPGYNGKGYPYCSLGECELDCSGYAYKYTLNGQPYCTDKSA